MEIKTNPNNKAKLNSTYRATGKHIDDNALTIASTPAFQTTFNKLKTNITANTAQQNSAALTSIAPDKNNYKRLVNSQYALWALFTPTLREIQTIR